MLCYLRYGILQRNNFSIGIPQSVFAQGFYAGTVCDIIQIVFSAVHWLDEVFVDLFDKVKGSLPIGCICIAFMLRQFLRFWETAEQALDVLLLFLCSREMNVFIFEELHTFAGSEVAGAVGQPSGISSAFHIGRDENQFRHVSSGSCRWTSWASSNLI